MAGTVLNSIPFHLQPIESLPRGHGNEDRSNSSVPRSGGISRLANTANLGREKPNETDSPFDFSRRLRGLRHDMGHYPQTREKFCNIPPNEGDGVVARLPPEKPPNDVGARFERDPGERMGLNGQHAFPLLGDETIGAARSGIEDGRRIENQGKLVVHARRATWNGIRRWRAARVG